MFGTVKEVVETVGVIWSDAAFLIHELKRKHALKKSIATCRDTFDKLRK